MPRRPTGTRPAAASRSKGTRFYPSTSYQKPPNHPSPVSSSSPTPYSFHSSSPMFHVTKKRNRIFSIRIICSNSCIRHEDRLGCLHVAGEWVFGRQQNGRRYRASSYIYSAIQYVTGGQVYPAQVHFLSVAYGLPCSDIITTMFVGNFIGIVCARSLHYQFYSWYFYSLPYLLWQTLFPTWLRLILFFTVELCWNVFPSNVYSSALLLGAHLAILGGLWSGPPEYPYADGTYEKTANISKKAN